MMDLNTTLGSPKEQPSDPHDKSRNGELHFLDMDSDSFKPAAGYDMLVVVPVHEPQETVYLTKSHGFVTRSIKSTMIGTGRVLRHVKDLTGSISLAGECRLRASHEFTVTVVMILCGSTGHEQTESQTPATLKELTDESRYRVASLALAKAASMAREHMTLKTAGPLMDRGDRFKVGVKAATKLRHRKVAVETRSLERDEALKVCRAMEDNLVKAYQSKADQLKETDPKMSEYLQSWTGSVSVTNLADVPEGLIQQMPTFTEPILASIPFSDKYKSILTKGFKLPLRQEPLEVMPMSEEEIYEPEAWASIKKDDDDYFQYFQLMLSETATREQLMHARPEPTFYGMSSIRPPFQGRLFDMRSGIPKLLEFTPPDMQINVQYWLETIKGTPMEKDEQLICWMKSGVTSLAPHAFQTVNQPPLLSLADGVPQVAAELKRQVGEKYIEKWPKRPFCPMTLDPVGARDKSSFDTQGRRKKRRIMDKGQPRVERLDTDRVRVQSYNEGSRQHTNLPHEDKPFLSDAMTDICIFKYVANLINWVVSGIADDIADCFLIFKNNPIELPRACFAYLYPEDDHLSFNVETSMGMGYVPSSNVAQRFNNTVVIIFMKEFHKEIAPLLEAAMREIPILKAWWEHRKRLEGEQAKVMNVNIYTDDMYGVILTPPDMTWVVVATEVWRRVTWALGLPTAGPDKRMAGAAVPWIGGLPLPMLGLMVITQNKTNKVLVGLAEAIAGKSQFEGYRKLVGLISFIRYILKLRRRTMNMVNEPLKGTHEAAGGNATTIKNSTARVNQWNEWITRMQTAHGAPCTVAMPNAAAPEKHSRLHVWYMDAAIKGTTQPGIAGYSHGMYFVFRLHKRHIEELHATALEFLAIIACFLIFGGMAAKPSEVLLQSDSLVSACVLSDDAAKAPIMVYLFNVLIERAEYQALEDRAYIGQTKGEGNQLSDNLSRGDVALMIETCRNLGFAPRQLPVPAIFNHIVEKAVQKAREFKERKPP